MSWTSPNLKTWVLPKTPSRSKKPTPKISTSVLLPTPKPFTVWITTSWKILKELGIPAS